MNQRTCPTCATTFTPTHSRNIYCDVACRKDEHAKVAKTCDCCGTSCMKAPTTRYKGTYCSDLCRDYTRWGALTKPLPSTHWARWYGATSEWTPPTTPEHTPPPFYVGTCQDCAAPIVERAYGVPSKWCSETCSRRANKRRRKAREHNAPGAFRFSDVMRQYVRQGKTCAYCHLPCTGLPDPEHVIPLSRGGSNNMTNIVAACRACNGDKRDLTPDEWASDRARRGLLPVDTSLSGPAFSHLVTA